MTVQDLIAKLAARGIAATEQQIDELLGSVEYLTDDDVPGIAEMLTASSHDPHAAGKSKRKAAGKLAKPGRSTSIQKADESKPVPLPSSAQIQKMDAGEVAHWVEQINAAGDTTQNDESALAALAALYNRQAELTAIAKAAKQAITTGNAAMQQAYGELNAAVSESLQGLQQIDQFSQVLAGEDMSRMAQNFRGSSNLAGRFTALINPDISGSGVQDTAA
jgi:hypothetical protein